MNFFSFVNQYADQVGGQYTEYDDTKSIVVVPVAEGRFQTVLLITQNTKSSGKQRGILTSKVCEPPTNTNLSELLELNASFDYSKFILEAGHLKVEATFPTDGASQDEIKYMIQEVANIADEYEMKLTGKDIH
jgi:hypothetical protein